MTSEGFLRRLGAGRAVNCVYHQGDLTGLISAWANDGRFVLTWEECRAGDQYNENSYSRDERHLFDTAEDLLAFVEESGYSAFAFSPCFLANFECSYDFATALAEFDSIEIRYGKPYFTYREKQFRPQTTR